ncbi:hypothetical protein BC628DRAFT_1409508 [Trametes gibbosa]|nr:hypothetical protein BC628DRAFT_1409508 [Trametes gibbosa]
MVATTFILTRAFAISALFVGAFPLAYAAPVPTRAVASGSVVLPRFCRQMGCLYALPEGATDSANTSDTATTTPISTETSSSALQVIDLLISALQSAASSIQQSASLPTTDTMVAAVAPASADTTSSGTLAAVVEAAAEAAAASIPTSSEGATAQPAVEVVGLSTIESADVSAGSGASGGVSHIDAHI